MPLSTYQLYHVHVQNLRSVDSACTHIFRELKRCIATRQSAAADALLKTFTLLIGAWSEVRLMKLLYEPNGFSDADRVTVLQTDTKINQWKLALTIGFRRRYDVPRAILSKKRSLLLHTCATKKLFR